MRSTLLHWTGRKAPDDVAFARLKSICETRKLRLSYCPIGKHTEWEKQILMACFTDLALSDSKELNKTFGRFAIGFDQQQFIKYGANPVFYSTPVNYLEIANSFEYLQQLDGLFADRSAEFYNSNKVTQEQLFGLHKIFGYIQEHTYRPGEESSAVDYLHREWRITFHSLAGTVGVVEEKPGTSGLERVDDKLHRYLNFSPNDVRYLICPKEYETQVTNIAINLGAHVGVEICHELPI